MSNVQFQSGAMFESDTIAKLETRGKQNVLFKIYRSNYSRLLKQRSHFVQVALKVLTTDITAKIRKQNKKSSFTLIGTG